MGWNVSLPEFESAPGGFTSRQWVAIILAQVCLALLLLASPLLAVGLAIGGTALLVGGVWASPSLVYLLLLLSIPSQYTTEGTRGEADIKSVHIFTIVAIITWFTQCVRRGKIEIDIRWVDIPVFLYVGWAFSTVFWAAEPGRTLFSAIKLSIALLTYFAMIFMVRDKATFNKILVAWVVVSFIWGVIGIYTMIFQSIPAAQNLTLQTGAGVVQKLGKTVRVSAIFENPNELAFFLSVAMVLAAVCFNLKGTTLWKLLIVVTFALGAAVLVGTFSRKSWLGVALSLLILSTKKPKLFLGLSALGLLAIGVILIASSTTAFGGALLDRLLSIAMDPEEGMAERAAVWNIAMDLFSAAPITGNGSGSFFIIAPTVGALLPIPHSLYMLVLVEYGLVGIAILALYFSIIAHGLIVTIRRSSDPFARQVALGLLATFVSVLFQAAFKTLAFTNYNFLAFFALVSIFLRNYQPRKLTYEKVPRRMRWHTIMGITPQHTSASPLVSKSA